MIARYAITYNGLVSDKVDVEMDDDGPWVRWNDIRAHVDHALSALNRDDPDSAKDMLAFIVNRTRS